LDRLALFALRCFLGAVAGGFIGLFADILFRTQGFWLIGVMAGIIAGATSIYWRPIAEDEETEPTPSAIKADPVPIAEASSKNATNADEETPPAPEDQPIKES
jgi:hypothetical protein